MSENTEYLMAKYAVSLVGCGYVYGATGWVCSPERRAMQAAQYPKQAKNIMEVCQKWDGKRCFDCAQLTRLCAAAGSVTLPSGATSQWQRGPLSERGKIDALPRKRVCLVFKSQGNDKMRHVGLYLGDGTVVHAKSSACGVVREALSKTRWTHYACMQGAETALTARVTAESGSTVNLRSKPDRASAVLYRVPLDSLVRITEEGEEWTRVQYLDAAGYMMTRYLVKE